MTSAAISDPLNHPERSLTVSTGSRQRKSKDPYELNRTNYWKRFYVSPLLLSVIATLTMRAQAQLSGNFPGSSSELSSPNGQYVIQNVDRDQEPRHQLFLKDKSTGKSRKVHEYTRHVDVLWAPDGRHFAVDGSAGSDYTDTRIHSVDESVREIDVQKEILAHRKNVPGGHHEYYYVANWIDANRVVVYHWGYGGDDPKGFCNCYVYRLNGTVHNCARQPKGIESVCAQTTPGRQ